MIMVQHETDLQHMTHNVTSIELQKLAKVASKEKPKLIAHTQQTAM